MKNEKTPKLKYEKSSGNVFTDLGLENSDQLLLKADLSCLIYKILKSRKLSQSDAAKILEVNQSEISRLKNADFSRFSIDRLFSFLNKLGRNVEIHIKKTKKKKPHQQIIAA